jgi:Protein of unknown function (DUF1761)
MFFMDVNLWAVLVAAVASMVLGFLWYSPALFARPWMLAMGYDPDDKSRIKEMQKSAGKSYGISFVASLVTAFVLGKIIDITTVEHGRIRNEGRLRGMAGICHDCAIDGKAVWQPTDQAVSDQHRLSIGVLPGDGSNIGCMAEVDA